MSTPVTNLNDKWDEKDFPQNALPCPFCSGTRIMHQSYQGVRFMRCDSMCSATGGYVFDWEKDVPFTREQSLKRWNERIRNNGN